MSSRIRLIDGFSSLTKQQMFDISAKHVLGNGKPGVLFDKDGRYNGCVYSGIGCAAAPFIHPDDRGIAYGGWYSVANTADNWHEQHFIGELQRCHDNAANDCIVPGGTVNNDKFLIDFIAYMGRLANRYALSTEVLNKA